METRMSEIQDSMNNMMDELAGYIRADFGMAPGLQAALDKAVRAEDPQRSRTYTDIVGALEKVRNEAQKAGKSKIAACAGRHISYFLSLQAEIPKDEEMQESVQEKSYNDINLNDMIGIQPGRDGARVDAHRRRARVVRPEKEAPELGGPAPPMQMGPSSY